MLKYVCARILSFKLSKPFIPMLRLRMLIAVQVQVLVCLATGP
jgi:hypothetical protein